MRGKPSVSAREKLLENTALMDSNGLAFREETDEFYLAKQAMNKRNRKDSIIFAENAARLEREATDVLGYQSLPDSITSV